MERWRSTRLNREEKVRFGFSIPPGAPAGVSDEVAAAEAMGYDRVGIWDSPALFREPWVTLAAVAQHTHHIKVTHGAVPDEQKEAYAALADKLGVRTYFQRRFTFAGTPDEVEKQVRSAIAAGATQIDGAIDAPLPEHRERITRWAELVMSRFA